MKKSQKQIESSERENFDFGSSKVTVDEKFIYIKIDRTAYAGVTKYGNPKLACPTMGKITLNDNTRYTINLLISEAIGPPSIKKTSSVMTRTEVLKLAKEKAKELKK